MKQGVYQIRNLVNKKRYIGSSIDLNKRKDEHFYYLRRNAHHNIHLQNSFNEYGESKFLFETIESNDNLDRDELYELEQFYIDSFNWENLYNINKDVKSGGSDVLSIPILLLDLNHNIIEEFESIQQCSRFLNKSQINSNRLNNNTIISNNYRIVTKDFYDSEIEEILSWKNKLEEQLVEEENREEYKRLNKIIYLDLNNKTYRFETLKEAGNFVNLSSERVRQILNSDWKINQKYKFYNLCDKETKYQNQKELETYLQNKPIKTKYDKYYKFDEKSNEWIVFTEDEIIAKVDNEQKAKLISKYLFKTLQEEE
jgi:group I intron endonuclease